MTQTNRQWLLKERPQGQVSLEHFQRVESSMPEPDFQGGEILVKNLWLSFDPAMRCWMDEADSYLPTVQLDTPVRAFGIAEVIASENPKFPLGSRCLGLFGWQEYAVVGPTSLLPPRKVSDDVSPVLALSVLGGTGTAAYFGMLEIGQPEEGDVVVVSGAAGAVGSVAAQIARIKGCTVIGIAGGSEKCDWLVNDCRLSAAVDYKSEDIDTRLAELCPKGIDVFFDNVGGDVLEIGINHMANYGRIVLCGMIAEYNDSTARPGPKNLMLIATRRLKMQGFVAGDFYRKYNETLADLGKWEKEGLIAHREDVQHGFEKIPETFMRLFNGMNKGKQLLEL